MCPPQSPGYIIMAEASPSPPKAEEFSANELSHNSLVQRAKDMLAVMLNDPFLVDLPPDCNAEEAKSQLALAQGKAITVHIRKYDGQSICK